MNTITKSHFLKMLKFRPQSLIGRQITYQKVPQIIHDVSLTGDSILLDIEAHGKNWYYASAVDDPVIIDSLPDDTHNAWEAGKGNTVMSVMFWKQFEEQEKLKKLLTENKKLHDQIVLWTSRLTQDTKGSTTAKPLDVTKVANIARDYFESVHGKQISFITKDIKKDDGVWIVTCEVGSCCGIRNYKLTIDSAGSVKNVGLLEDGGVRLGDTIFEKTVDMVWMDGEPPMFISAAFNKAQ